MAKDYSYFKEILSTFTVKRPINDDGWTSFKISGLARVGIKQEHGESVIQCWYKEQHEPGYKPLKKAIETDLRFNGHFIYPQLVDDILAFFACLRSSSGAVGYELMEEVLGSITEYTVKRWQLIPFWIKRLEIFKSINGWEFGSLDHEKLKFETDIKGNSNFHEKWGSYLERNKLDYAIISKPLELKIIDIHCFPQRIAMEYLPLVEECINVFMDHIIEQVNLSINQEFEEANNILIAAGKNSVDLYRLSRMPIGFNIYIFRSKIKGKDTWIQGKLPSFNINAIQPGDQKLLEEQAFIEEYRLNDDRPTEVLHAAKSLSRFMGKAGELLFENRTDEAFLHHMIGIEIALVRSEDAIGKVVSTRLAVLTHRKANKDYLSQKKHVTELYQRRSQYVHEGCIKPTLEGEAQWEINQISLDEASRLSMELLMWLLRVNRKKEGGHVPTINDLLKTLDLMASAYDANRPPDDGFYRDLKIEF